MAARSLNLRRLARNSFLLTLLCGFALRAKRAENGGLRTSRTALYKVAIEVIYQQDQERRQHERWNKDRRRQVEYLAPWLLDEAREAPCYVFGSEEVLASGAERNFLERYLKPARLLAQWALVPDTHHFLHATFQEFLAACALSQSKPGKLLGYLRRHFYSGAWHEVFRSMAGLKGPAREVFWQEMPRLAREPDRYGHLFLRLARFAAEAGFNDGGRAKLGVDLRDGLWVGVRSFTRNTPFIDTYAELDLAGLALRVQRSLLMVDRRTERLLLRAAGRTKTPEASGIFIERIIKGDPDTYAAALSQVDLFKHQVEEKDLARLRAVLISPHTSSHCAGVRSGRSVPA
jgi:hypothetical protein